MARKGTSKQPNYGLIILYILYAAILIFAVWSKFDKNADSSFEISVVCSIIAVFFAFLISLSSDSGGSEDTTQKHAKSLWPHIVLWTGIIFLPFGDYPKISLALVAGFAIYMSGTLAAFTKEENEAETKKAQISLSKLARTIVIIFISLIVVLYLFNLPSVNSKITSLYNVVANYLESNKKVKSNEVVFNNDGSGIGSNNSTSAMEATFNDWADPFEFGINTAFKTGADGIIDPNNTGNTAVNLVIYLSRGGGNIIMNNGVVETADSESGKITCSGTWTQQDSNLSGTYFMDVKENSAELTLVYNNSEVALITINNN